MNGAGCRLATSALLTVGVLFVPSPTTRTLVAVGAQVPAATPRSISQKLRTCRLPNLDEDVLCGQFEVFENRDAATGRKISLKIVVLPSRGSPVEPDALTFLAGGGVVPATRYAPQAARWFKMLREHRDILLIDQRGTGGSNRLGCTIPEEVELAAHREPEPYLAALRKCRADLETRADLRCYNTPMAVGDLDEVRAWLGYTRLNLYGTSYGTSVAQTYLRNHPDRVRTIALHGPMPLDLPMWQDIAVSAQQALDRLFEECRTQSACAAAFPKVREEFAAVLTRLRATPESVTVEGPGGPTRAVIDDEIVRSLVYGALYSARPMGDIPLLIHSAFTGDDTPIGEIMTERPPEDGSAPKGVFLSILCSESIPLVDPTVARRAAEGTFLGRWVVDKPLGECSQWVRARLPTTYWEPVKSAVPALVLVGALDHATPVRYAEHIAQGLSRSRLIVLPARGHNDVDSCVTGLIEAFVISGRIDGFDASCAANRGPLTFRTSFPRSPEGEAPCAGSSRLHAEPWPAILRPILGIGRTSP
jgi:pimeloyl-ACP methyl ester carboxylesterase